MSDFELQVLFASTPDLVEVCRVLQQRAVDFHIRYDMFGSSLKADRVWAEADTRDRILRWGWTP